MYAHVCGLIIAMIWQPFRTNDTVYDLTNNRFRQINRSILSQLWVKKCFATKLFHVYKRQTEIRDDKFSPVWVVKLKKKGYWKGKTFIHCVCKIYCLVSLKEITETEDIHELQAQFTT
jgi:hypothetical protein